MVNKSTLSIKQFIELTEIYTAPLNLFIILLGVSSARYLTHSNVSADLLVFVVIIMAFHIAVNVFNHWKDYENAQDENYKQVTNIIGRDKLAMSTVKRHFYIPFAVSLLAGAYLVYQTNLLIGLMGAVGFYIGLFYSYGRYPLNSLPIAEIVTATASGFAIPTIAYYLTTLHSAGYQAHFISSLAAISLPLVISMFNNLLANNICDLDEDINNGRKTLVYYLGKKNSVKLLLGLTYFSYFWLIVLVSMKLAPIPVLFLLLLLPIIYKKLAVFKEVQDKKKTFPVILKTMGLMMMLYPILYTVGSLINK